jgi:hypothetical protein
MVQACVGDTHIGAASITGLTSISSSPPWGRIHPSSLPVEVCSSSLPPTSYWRRLSMDSAPKSTLFRLE